MTYDVLSFVQAQPETRRCVHCRTLYERPALTEHCAYCMAYDCCPACLKPLDSELAKRTILLGCPACRERDRLVERKAA